jgi:hypothetical protein
MSRLNRIVNFVSLPLSILIFLVICFVYLPGKIDLQYIGAFVDDSYILFRYSEHLAMGQGFIWNLGGEPTEGLSSIVWAALIAGAVLLSGLSYPLAALYLGVGFGVLTIIVVWKISLELFQGNDRRFAWLPTTLLAIMPIFARHSVSGMETVLVVFGYSLLMWLMRLPQSHSTGRIAAIGVFAGLFYLIRPEAPMVGFLLPSVAYAFASPNGETKFTWQAVWGNRRKLLIFGFVFVGFTFSTFAARWIYFDSFLPLPAYMKLGFARHNLASQTNFIVTQWAQFFSYAAYLLLPILFWIVARPKHRPQEIGALVSIGAFCLYMLQVVPVMNFSLRYFTPLVGILVVLSGKSVAYLSRKLTDDIRSATLMALAFFGLAGIVSVGNMNAAKIDRGQRPNDQAIAVALSYVRDITLHYSEAGIIPFYSKQKFIDCAGLNEKFIAQNRYRDGFEFRYWPYVRATYGLPDVHFEVTHECTRYAGLELLSEPEQRLYEKLPNVCGLTLYILTTSPKYPQIRNALTTVKCPAD